MTTLVTGALTATGSSATVFPRSDLIATAFNLSLWGSFSATVQIQRSFDNGATWLPRTSNGTVIAYTAPCSEIVAEPESGVAYRVTVTAFSSGTVNYRISQ